MSEEWKNGLCREFAKGFGSIVRHNQYGKNEFNFNQIGFDAISLYREMFGDE